MTHTFTSYAWIAALGVGWICGCGEATDDTPLEVSRDQRISDLAKTACDRYADTAAGCPGYGTGSSQAFATEAQCREEFSKRAAELWPVDRCTARRIDDARFKVCVDRAKTYACSTGLQSVLDAVGALDQCKADTVCVDPAG